VCVCVSNDVSPSFFFFFFLLQGGGWGGEMLDQTSRVRHPAGGREREREKEVRPDVTSCHVCVNPCSSLDVKEGLVLGLEFRL
jgi:hypothetical protein